MEVVGHLSEHRSAGLIEENGAPGAARVNDFETGGHKI